MPGPAAGPPVPGARRRLALTGVPETLVIPLYARALDYRSRHSILRDARADAIVRSLDYDFEKFRSRGGGRVLVARNRQLDEWVREFLRRYPRGSVLQVGCGLDTRVDRIAPPPSVLWWDVDLAEVIAVRRNLFPERAGYRMLGGSITEPSWLSELPGDRPTIVVADGVFEYLGEGDVQRFLDAFAARFAHGAAIFDVMSASVQRMANQALQGRSSAVLQWAVDDLRGLDGLLPRYRRTATVRLLTSRFLPLGDRLVYAVGCLAPRLRNSMRAVRYEF